MTRRSALALFFVNPDPYVILDQSVTLDKLNMEKLRGYVWSSEEKSYSKGVLQRQQAYEINLVSGAMYWRRVDANGQPLTGAELAAERQRLARHLAAPGPGFNWRAEREYLELLPRVHTARYLGEEMIDGRPNHLIETSPHPSATSRLLTALSYKLWIDKAELHWRRAEITVVKKVEWLLHQLAIGRISYPYSNNIVNQGSLKPGAKTTIELQRLPEGIWTLARYHTQSGKDFSNELRYFNYRRFTSESQLLTDPL